MTQTPIGRECGCVRCSSQIAWYISFLSIIYLTKQKCTIHSLCFPLTYSFETGLRAQQRIFKEELFTWVETLQRHLPTQTQPIQYGTPDKNHESGSRLDFMVENGRVETFCTHFDISIVEVLTKCSCLYQLALPFLLLFLSGALYCCTHIPETTPACCSTYIYTKSSKSPCRPTRDLIPATRAV